MQIKEEAGGPLLNTEERNDSFRTEEMDIEVHTYIHVHVVLIYVQVYITFKIRALIYYTLLEPHL